MLSTTKHSPVSLVPSRLAYYCSIQVSTERASSAHSTISWTTNWCEVHRQFFYLIDRLPSEKSTCSNLSNKRNAKELMTQLSIRQMQFWQPHRKPCYMGHIRIHDLRPSSPLIHQNSSTCRTQQQFHSIKKQQLLLSCSHLRPHQLSRFVRYFCFTNCTLFLPLTLSYASGSLFVHNIMPRIVLSLFPPSSFADGGLGPKHFCIIIQLISYNSYPAIPIYLYINVEVSLNLFQLLISELPFNDIEVQCNCILTLTHSW